MKTYRRSATVILIAVAFYAASAQAQGFPDGPGKQIVQEACSVCHDSEMITTMRRSKEEWTETVQDMVSRGAPLLEGEREIVIDYLSKNFGPEKAARGKQVPERKVASVLRPGRVTEPRPRGSGYAD